MLTAPLCTPAQLIVLRTLFRTGKHLIRLPNGEWTYQGAPTKSAVPWTTKFKVVRSLEELGLLTRTKTYPEYWRDNRALTEKGRLAGA